MYPTCPAAAALPIMYIISITERWGQSCLRGEARSLRYGLAVALPSFGIFQTRFCAGCWSRKMNGIRYASACLGGSSHKLFRNSSSSRSWRRCEKSQSVRQNANYIATATSRDFHHGVSCCAIAEDDAAAVTASTKRNVAVGPDLADFILANTKSKVMFDTRADEIPYLKNVESGGRSGLIYYQYRA